MEKQTLRTKGKLLFDPVPISGNKKKMFKPWWLILKLDDDITAYYRWFFIREKGLMLQKSAWGSHVSVIRGEVVDKDLWEQIKEKYSGKEIEIEYELIPKTNGKHVWLRSISKELLEIREEFGLGKSEIGFHITLGSPIERMKEHLKYLHKIKW